MQLGSSQARLSAVPTPAILTFSSALLMSLACGPAPSGTRDSDAEGASSDSSSIPSESDADSPGETDTGGEDDGDACRSGINDCPDGEKCLPYVSEEGGCCADALMCVPVKGDAQFGEPCERARYWDTCAKDLVCFAGTSAKEGPGECLQMCNGEDPNSCVDIGLPFHTCIPHSDGIYVVCHGMCHPFPDDCNDPHDPDCVPGCPHEEDACFYSGFESHGYLCARPDPADGEGKDGDECYAIQACHAGLQCWPADQLEGCEGLDCCTPSCNLDDDGDACTGEEACVPVFPPDNLPHPMYGNAGVCGLAG